MIYVIMWCVVILLYSCVIYLIEISKDYYLFENLGGYILINRI